MHRGRWSQTHEQQPQEVALQQGQQHLPFANHQYAGFHALESSLELQQNGAGVQVNAHLANGNLQHQQHEVLPSQLYNMPSGGVDPRHAVWMQVFDANSGRMYYFNTVTGQTSAGTFSGTSTLSASDQTVLDADTNVDADANTAQRPTVSTEAEESLSDRNSCDDSDNGSVEDSFEGLIDARCWGRPAHLRNVSEDGPEPMASAHARFRSLSSIDKQSLEQLAAYGRKRRPKRHPSSSSSRSLGEGDFESAITNPDATEDLLCSCMQQSAEVAGQGKAAGSSDVNAVRGRHRRRRSSLGIAIPTRNAIFAFIQNVYLRAQMEKECILMSFVYLERLLKATRGQLALNESNWKGVVLSTMILASKVWDDLSMSNGDFAKICPSFALKRINQIEVCLLEAMAYEVRVSSSQYTKYFFQLRSMRKVLGIPIIKSQDDALPANQALV
ncbi:Cyclin-Y-like protein 1 [Hondaea fermentalgiana]|uniref:Cyclin-Y-like protein 1 n=1 Tax=Hondaea fermentalgiana TaxID=2315210 RepID=A0A2R5GB06_9STRA|nr:Cyclin-Y-like protein 1 [Hondaea fermentalgiana]|eukprot:GBG28180.1 Cyclin-Y-like protein 1 [Hondaea fermentalgiana]